MRLKFIPLFAFLLTSIATKEADFYTYKDCKNFDNSKVVENISIEFNQEPKSGHNCEAIAKADLLQDINIDRANVVIFLGMNKLVDTPVRRVLKYKQGKGITYKVKVPTEWAPPGFYHGKMEFFETGSDTPLLCYEYSIKVAPPTFN
jgi:hypothetical protein